MVRKEGKRNVSGQSLLTKDQTNLVTPHCLEDNLSPHVNNQQPDTVSVNRIAATNTVGGDSL
jgi:hypothetical protein